DPLVYLNQGFAVSALLCLVSLWGCCFFMLGYSDDPATAGAWYMYAMCGTLGLVAALAFLAIVQYYTDCNYGPVNRIITASETGDATNVIAGLAVGFESAALPVLVIGAALVCAYQLGMHAGFGVDPESMYTDTSSPGLFGTAVATMGMLMSVCYVLALDTFGPISDNAGGVVELSQQPASVREKTDRLDAVGNTTKALTKGYAIGSAGLAAFLLFGAYCDTVESIIQSHSPTHSYAPFTLSLAIPENFVSGLLGAGLVFYFCALCIQRVGETSEIVIEEVRRQFREHPGIIDFSEKPDYQICVSKVTKGALLGMIVPGLLVVVVPVTCGLVFKFEGSMLNLSNSDTIGAEAVGTILMSGTITGFVTASMLNNAGGAWDNAKKRVEEDATNRGTAKHKASITGDTVGDPLKDTAGPAVHVLVKLLANTCVVMAPLLVGKPQQ
ncbi:pyrophosphate-energised proton pump, partial [Kipferlia bialata]